MIFLQFVFALKLNVCFCSY